MAGGLSSESNASRSFVPQPFLAYLLPSLAGVVFALIGYAYRKGQARGLPTTVIVVYMMGVGAVFFGGKALLSLPLADAPARIWILGVTSGLAQYATIKLVGAALQRGPLSPVWCALNLVFVPVILYAALFLGEVVDMPKVFGILAAVASVLVGSLNGGNAAPGAPAHAPRGRTMMIYLLVLVSALLANSLLHGSIKDLGGRSLPDGRTLMESFGDLFLGVMYVCAAVPTALDLWRVRRPDVFTGWAVGLGMMAAAGSLGGMALLAAASAYPASIVFTLSAVLSLVGGALVSVIFFGERLTPAWFGMMGLALAAVLLVSV